MARIHWRSMSYDHAQTFATAWWAGEDARLAWLGQELGTDLSAPDEAHLDLAWNWYVGWRKKAKSAKGLPAPLWWTDRATVELDKTAFSSEAAVGVDALAHLSARVLRVWDPKLLAVVPTTTPPALVSNHHEPCLAVRPDGWSASVLRGCISQCHTFEKSRDFQDKPLLLMVMRADKEALAADALTPSDEVVIEPYDVPPFTWAVRSSFTDAEAAELGAWLLAQRGVRQVEHVLGALHLAGPKTTVSAVAKLVDRGLVAVGLS